MATDLLIIMARYPTPGKVKTRLARQIGQAAATQWYRQLLFRYRRQFHRTAYHVQWWFTPARAPFRRLFWLNQANGRPQPAGDLGQRMAAIFHAAFAEDYQRVIMIGTDAPELGPKTVQEAFHLLRQQPVVFQPTEDGGYALIGMTQWMDLFSQMPWSTTRLGSATRQRLRRLGLTHAELPPTYDVDTAADYQRAIGLESRLQAGRLPRFFPAETSQ